VVKSLSCLAGCDSLGDLFGSLGGKILGFMRLPPTEGAGDSNVETRRTRRRKGRREDPNSKLQIPVSLQGLSTKISGMSGTPFGVHFLSSFGSGGRFSPLRQNDAPATVYQPFGLEGTAAKEGKNFKLQAH
jgi:hypothetical protein